jgi:hypothetical protein
MHGQQTMKFLNDKAAADAILAKHKQDPDAISPAFEKVVQEALAAKAKAVATK